MCTTRLAEPTEREPEVERGADHDDHVGLGLEQRRVARERQLVVSGQAPSTEPVRTNAAPAGSRPRA